MNKKNIISLCGIAFIAFSWFLIKYSKISSNIVSQEDIDMCDGSLCFICPKGGCVGNEA